MSLASQLVHSCSISRPTHDKTDRQKVLGETVVATSVACRVESTSDTAQATALGIGQVRVWRGFFMGDADLLPGDILLLSTGETCVARGVEPRWAGGPDIHHLEATLEVRDA